MEKSRLRNRPPQSLRSVSLLLFLLSFKLVKDRSSCHPTDPTASSDAHPFLKCECKGTHYFQTAKLFERFFLKKIQDCSQAPLRAEKHRNFAPFQTCLYRNFLSNRECKNITDLFLMQTFLSVFWNFLYSITINNSRSNQYRVKKYSWFINLN